MRAIAVGRTARRRLRLEPPLVGRDGALDARDATAARRIAARLNQARAAEPERQVAGGDVTAIAVLGAILHEVVRRERAAAAHEVDRAAEAGAVAVGPTGLASVRRAWRREFGDAEPATPELVGNLLVLSALNENPAAVSVRELVDDRPLRDGTPYVRLLGAIENELGGTAAGPPGDGAPGAEARARARRATTPGAVGARRRRLALPALLRAPARSAPGSLADQLRWIRANWPEILAGDPALAERVALAIDVLAEEARAFELRAAGAGFGGPIAAETPDYRGLDAEPEAFSPDTEWMPSVVLLAKSSHVWLNQLARTYGRPIANLADVPDEELDRLASLGVTGLWLIGLWQRSRASADIKRRRGDLDAVASAYSIDEYRIADDLGGEAAFGNLKERAAARGIRLAADMVPNHMGLDSGWVVEHPDRFMSVPEAPYPAYGFTGPDLSPDHRVELTIEDHYWDGTDAAVVFRRRDTQSGETRFIYHGNDGTSFPWNDTAQLDYLQPAVREDVIRTILAVARRAPILRFDAAMVLARRHIRRLWYPRPGEGGAIPSRAEHAISDAEFDALMPTEFWREVVDRVARDAPGTLLLAEAFWLMEGYFVRTLGMHRVYNSAFMHMLREEDNAGYRRVMKDTLEFDPGVLGRFVNFLTNPDERPAAEQFGTGDKAFAAATLLATMPGLPMLGHGQVEGFRERYGMEFRAARWDEPVDMAHADHFGRVVVPLLRRRADFAGTEHFHLYDPTAGDGSVVEDVYAYSNERDGRRTLVVVHNRFAEVDVRIDRSVAAATKDANGHKRKSTTRLGRALGLPPDDATTLRFRDARSGRELWLSAGEVRDRGLSLHVGPYEAVVFDVEVAPAGQPGDGSGNAVEARDRAEAAEGLPLGGLPDAPRRTAERAREALRAIFGDDVVAAWVHGGSTFPDRSRVPGDLDLAVVLRGTGPEERSPRRWRRDGSSRVSRLAAAFDEISKETGVALDPTFVLEAEARLGRRPAAAFDRARRENDWAVLRAHLLAGQFIGLWGPAPRELLVPPSRRELRYALDRELEHLERHVASGDAADPFEATYAVWNGSRILRTLATGDAVASKRSAGEWALRALPKRWRPVLQAAGRAYDGVATDADRRLLEAETGPFVRLVRRRLGRRPARSTGRRRRRAEPRWS